MSARKDRIARADEQWRLFAGEHTRQPWSKEAQWLLTSAETEFRFASDYASRLARRSQYRAADGKAAHVHEGSEIGLAKAWLARTRNLVQSLHKRQEMGGLTPAEMYAATRELEALHALRPEVPAPRRSADRAARPSADRRIRNLEKLARTPKAEAQARLRAAAMRIRTEADPSHVRTAAYDLAPLVYARVLSRGELETALLEAARDAHIDNGRLEMAINDGMVIAFGRLAREDL